NSWGVGPEGGCIGCGPQEGFYGCADFRIIPSNASQPNPASSSTNQTSTIAPVTNPAGPTPVTKPANPTPRMPTNCEAKYRQTSLNSWCQETCQKGYCNKRHCTCPDADQKTPRVCKPKPNSSQTTDRCTVNCVAGYCPHSNCDCF
ncbi:unnamed protein product, partial [Candidula unifasciata]